jgi:NTP pyrophosphatase (non-canonical NTP hydrolase)
MKHNRTITEARVQELSELMYGVNPYERMKKLIEEIQELKVSIDNDGTEAVKEELSDCLFVLISLMWIYDTNIRELVEMAIDKITTREKNPNYKRDGKQKIDS